MKDLFSIKLKDNSIRDNKIEKSSYNPVEFDYTSTNQESMDASTLVEPIKNSRIYWLYFLFIFCFLIIIGRITWLQIVLGNKYENIAEGNRIRITKIKPDRGLIYDSNLNLLVENIPKFSLIVVPGDLPKDELIKATIINALNKKMEELEISTQEQIKIFENLNTYSYNKVILKNNLSHLNAMKLMLVVNNLQGILLEPSSQRYYLMPANFSHILGYVGKLNKLELTKYPDYLITDNIGKTGIELYYEDVLKGKYGRKKIEVDSLGKEKNIIFQEKSISGQNIVLSINAELQRKISEILIKHIKKNKSRAGTIIAMNPSNGQILAMFSWPSYDNNIFIDSDKIKYESIINNPDKPLVFRAIAGEYPSGSIIKPIIAIGALEEEVISGRTLIYSTGGINVDKWFFADWKKGGHGYTDVIKALSESVNTFFYYIGGGFEKFNGLGIDKIHFYTNLFGLNQLTNIDLPTERAGLIANPEWKQAVKKEQWYIGDTYHVSIGQGDVLVTPIQVVNYISAIANNGTLFEPSLVKEIQAQANQTNQQISPKILRQNFVSQESIELIKTGLRRAVTTGSAKRLSTLKINVAGKTGTAQVGGDKEPHAWFIGFAPYENPEIAFVVLIENGGEGSKVAVPVAKELLEWFFDE
ncbi:penicillin-binding protein 2 [Patescibacteria group bacterium]|nr:penicillin-binding protein 2 [Patescibacteria group bacterium]